MILKFIFLLLINLLSNILCEKCDFVLPVITDLTPNDCYEKPNYYYWEEQCFPVCKKYPTSTGKIPCPNGNECLPGYKCGKSKRCLMDITSCGVFYASTTDNKRSKFYKSLFKPKCAKDTSWAPKQCKGEATTGRCFCYNSIGERIFGEEWAEDAGDMTCACSHKKAELLAQHPNKYSTLHCDSKGNFEPLQCDEGQCWCAEPTTGKLTSIVVPESAMTKLSCYNSTTIGAQYLRKCESKLFAQTKILNELNIHGTKSTFGPVLCDFDGSFGRYKIDEGMSPCTWNDDTKIKSWAGTLSDIASQNCNCARDFKIYQLAGITWTQQCKANGNYKPLQQIGTTSYCVDNDGFVKSPNDATPQSDEDCDSYY